MPNSVSVSESLRHNLTVTGDQLELTLVSGEKGADGPNTVTSSTTSDGSATLNVATLDADAISVTGNISAVDGTFSGDVTAADGTFSGDVTAVDGTFSGDVSTGAITATGNVTANNFSTSGSITGRGINGEDGTFSGDVTAVGGTFTGNVTAVHGFFSGDVVANIVTATDASITIANIDDLTATTLWAGASGEFTVSGVGNVTAGDGTFTGNVTAVDGTFSGDVNANTVNANTVTASDASVIEIIATDGVFQTITAGASYEFGVSSVGNVTAVDGTFTGIVAAEGGNSTEWNAAYTDRTPFSVITGTGGEIHARYKSDGWTKGEIDAIDTSFGASDVEAVIFGTEVPEAKIGILKNQVGLKFVNFGEIEIIAYEACRGCNSLERVIMRSIDKIGQHAFNGCSSLSDIDLGSVVDIGAGGFKDCVSLTLVTIPASVTVLGNNVFDGCSSLSEVNCYANYSVFNPTGGNVFKDTASPLTIHARPNTGWTAASGIFFQGNPNVTIILDLV